MLYSNNKYFISIVITAYNSEKTIERCIQSVLSQTASIKIQLVIIDDCSSDSTKEICEKLLRNTEVSYLIFANPQNMGVGHSRQEGINRCLGDYILFLDSDDYLESNCLNSLYTFISENEKADIILFDYYMTYDNSNIITQCNFKNKDLAEQIISGSVYGFLWNKLIRKSLFKDVRFIDSVNMWEDVLVTSIIAKKTDKVFYLNEPFIHYVQNPYSNVHKAISTNTITSMVIVINELMNSFCEEQYKEAITHRIMEFYTTLYLRAEYDVFMENIELYKFRKRDVFKLNQYNFILKIIFFSYLMMPTKFNFKLTKRIYSIIRGLRNNIKGVL